MLPQSSSSQSQSSGTSTVPKKKNPFSVKPLNITTKSTMDASYKRLIWIWDEVQWAGVDRELLAQDYIKTFLIPNATDKQLIVGNLKGSLRLTISSLLSLSTLLMKESVQYLKAKMTTFVQSAAVCMQRISRAGSKAKVSMLQTIWMIWKNTSSNQSEQTHSSETLLSFPSKIELMNGWHDLPDGTSAIQCSTVSGRLEILYKHEYDLLTRISQVLRLDGTHILNLEECMMAYGKVYDTLLASKS